MSANVFICLSLMAWLFAWIAYIRYRRKLVVEFIVSLAILFFAIVPSLASLSVAIFDILQARLSRPVSLSHLVTMWAMLFSVGIVIPAIVGCILLRLSFRRDQDANDSPTKQ
ncbi:MAG: hypothetical protein KDN22_13320 [Verrucomicrobiae bacterium]|nr:hypothetical protein [Verrucomicrobiae bacterium]